MTPDKNRNQIIDAFRAVAILSVMIFHYTRAFPDAYGFDRPFPKDIDILRCGVQLFFVISGLVISMTILKTHSTHDFVVKRFARLFPTLFVCCSVTWLIEYQFGSQDFQASVADYFFSLILMAKKFKFHYVDGAYWTLNLEVGFYICVAIGYALMRSKFWIAVVLVAPFWHSYYTFFLIGIWMYYYLFDRTNPAVKWLLPIVIIFSLWTSFADGVAKDVYTILTTLGLFLALRFIPQTRLGPLAWTGRISYPFYLLHENLGVMIIIKMKRIGYGDYLAIGCAAATCLLLAATVHYIVEMPVQREILRYWTRRSQSRLTLKA